MIHKIWVGLMAGSLALLGLLATIRPHEALAQRAKAETVWEYKVGVFSYNPGERMSDEQRAASYAKTLNEQGLQGWEPVGSLLSRDMVQTVGGGVTTRDTTSFVAYRRARP